MEATNKPVDIFQKTLPRRINGLYRFRMGVGFSKADSSEIIKKRIRKEIRETIKHQEIPQICFDLKFRHEKRLFISIEIVDTLKPVVLRDASVSDPEIDCVTTCDRRVRLNDTALYIRDVLIQILWKYNADVFTPDAKFGITRFQYQVTYSQELIASEIDRSQRKRTLSRHAAIRRLFHN